ncbi:hypothetical protein FKW77_007318 [Venturia effusa]|uniref:Uncharacterized protein n=1 Tax=Venturia effusa TaxID=50376 RepID=A0A517LFU6_9PEZI|nr:hypothetical protein FKW77_007318 [Venturia effusa]
MKFITALLFSIFTLTVAEPTGYGLCCCATWNKCIQLHCKREMTAMAVYLSRGHWVLSNKAWDRADGAPIGGPLGWMYEKKDPYYDYNGEIDAEEVKSACRSLGLDYRCFTPKEDWTNGSGNPPRRNFGPPRGPKYGKVRHWPPQLPPTKWPTCDMRQRYAERPVQKFLVEFGSAGNGSDNIRLATGIKSIFAEESKTPGPPRLELDL